MDTKESVRNEFYTWLAENFTPKPGLENAHDPLKSFMLRHDAAENKKAVKNEQFRHHLLNRLQADLAKFKKDAVGKAQYLAVKAIQKFTKEWGKEDNE